MAHYPRMRPGSMHVSEVKSGIRLTIIDSDNAAISGRRGEKKTGEGRVSPV